MNCRYCGESNNSVESKQDTLENNLESVIEFLAKDPDPRIVFYGGEPLLKIPLMREVMDRLPASTFLLQTNGLLLKKLDPRYIHSLDTILVSIDGSQEITNFNRGNGTFQTLRENLKKIKQIGYKGDLIARMTISHKNNIYNDVKFLMKYENPSFSHIHWQLDVIWSDLDSWHDFNNWVETSYNPGISKLVDEWVDIIKLTGIIPGIVPFIGIMYTLLTDTIMDLRCGAGIDSFSIHTNGVIYACPVCPEFDDFVVGDVLNSTPRGIYRSRSIKTPCTCCEVYNICGGRCLFANHHNFWGDEFKTVCKTVKHLINELKRVKPILEDLIEKRVISLENLSYPKYNNSCEIIP